MTGLAAGFWILAQTGIFTPNFLPSFFLELPGMMFGGLAAAR